MYKYHYNRGLPRIVLTQVSVVIGSFETVILANLTWNYEFIVLLNALAWLHGGILCIYSGVH